MFGRLAKLLLGWLIKVLFKFATPAIQEAPEHHWWQRRCNNYRLGDEDPPEYYIENMFTRDAIFEIGEGIVSLYGPDMCHEKERVYRRIVELQREVGEHLNEEYLKKILTPDLFANYLCIKETYIQEIELGDSYDHTSYAHHFSAEATATRAYLLLILQLIYVEGHQGHPLPVDLCAVINTNPGLFKGEPCRDMKEDRRRARGRVLMNFENVFTDFNDQ